MNAHIFVELSGGHGEILEVFDHLEARVRHTVAEIFVSQGHLAVRTRGIGPSEDG